MFIRNSVGIDPGLSCLTPPENNVEVGCPAVTYTLGDTCGSTTITGT